MVVAVGRELEYLERCVRDGEIALGGRLVRRFEERFADYHGMPEAIATTSGTAAIHLVLAALGVGPGDAVICPSIDFIGGVNPIRYCGAEPVIVGVEPNTLHLDPELLASLLEQRLTTSRDRHGPVLVGSGRRLKAVVVAELYGFPARLDEIVRICRPYGVPVVSDSAESLGARLEGAPAGTGADISCFSFNTNKIITSGGGGMILTRDPRMAARCRHLRVHARSEPFEYRHDAIGFNYRMSNLCAAVGCAQLEQLEKQIRRHRARYERIVENLTASAVVEPVEVPAGCRTNAWMLLCKTRRDDLLGGLRRAAARGVPVRPIWYPVQELDLYAGVEYWGRGDEMALYQSAFCFKSSEPLTDDQIVRSVAVLEEELSPPRGR